MSGDHRRPGDAGQGPGGCGGSAVFTASPSAVSTEDETEIEEQPAMRSIALTHKNASVVRNSSPNAMVKRPIDPSVTVPPVSLDLLSRCTGRLAMESERSGPAPSPAWVVKDEDLKSLLPDFHLERTHRRICGTKARVIAARIANVLRDLSVDAAYDASKARAKCRTIDAIDFCIRLYRAGDAEDDAGVIVEVQRRRGPAATFARLCRAVLDAAEGRPVPSPDGLERAGRSPFDKLPVAQMACLRGVYHLDARTEADAALERVARMLRSESAELQRRAFEDLCFLTDTNATNVKVAERVAECLLLGDGCCRLREDMMAFATRENDSSSLLRSDPGWCHHIAGVFSRSTRLCRQSGWFSAVLDEQSWFQETLLPFLLDVLLDFESRLGTAALAASCLADVLASSQSIRDLLQREGASRLLQKVHRVGDQRHLLLANESRRCLDELGAVRSDRGL